MRNGKDSTTAGPWVAWETGQGRLRVSTQASISSRDSDAYAGREKICQLPIRPNGKANAVLIAAAPDMLNLLISILEKIDDDATMPAECLRPELRAVISKATSDYDS